MPIRVENKRRYPPNWSEISKEIREAAAQRCEWCFKPNGEMVTVIKTRSLSRAWFDPLFQVWRNVGPLLGGKLINQALGDRHPWQLQKVKVVLTVAHLDHQPENCNRENLRALCQQCHNMYDAPERAAGRRRRARSEQMALGFST